MNWDVIIINEKEIMSLNKSGKGFVGGFSVRKGKGNVIIWLFKKF